MESFLITSVSRLRIPINRYVNTFGEPLPGDNVVFDIDGTLLNGKCPIHAVTRWFKHLVKKGCLVYIITARTECSRADTIRQLRKHGIDGYQQLVMFPPPYHQKRIKGRVTLYKQCAMERIGDVVLTVGDMWGDLLVLPETDIGELNGVREWNCVIGPGFVKLPDNPKYN